MALDGLNEIIATVRELFAKEDAAREKAIALSREAIRLSATAIKHIHRGEFDMADRLIHENRRVARELTETVAGYDDLRAAGFVADALKEYAEAIVTEAIMLGKPLPPLLGDGLDHAAYVNGLAEAVGELRRCVLDNIRHGKVDVSERLLESMDDIYYALLGLDFPENVTRGLRRRTDSIRAIIEKTRGDITFALRQQELMQKIDSFESRFNES